MAWAQQFTQTPENKTRADLTRELDIAVHGKQTITHPVTEAKWNSLIEEVICLRVENERC